MTLYGILKVLVLPPGIILLLLLAAFWVTRGVLARLFIFTALTVMTLLSLPVVGTSLMQPLELYPPLGADSSPLPTEAQAIVILGGGRRTQAPEYGGDTLDDVSLRRVRYGALLHRETGLPVYVTGGRWPNEQISLAQIMAEVLGSDYGIQAAGVESRSRTTWENAAFTAPILKQDGISNVLLVSDAWHLPRAVEVFERNGIDVTPAPTAFVHHPGWWREMTYRDWLPSMHACQISYYAIHEHLGRLWYQLREWTQGSPELQVQA